MPRPRARGGGLSVAVGRFCIVNNAPLVDGSATVLFPESGQDSRAPRKCPRPDSNLRPLQKSQFLG